MRHNLDLFSGMSNLTKKLYNNFLTTTKSVVVLVFLLLPFSANVMAQPCSTPTVYATLPSSASITTPQCIQLDESITIIPDNHFEGNTNITGVIANGVTSIGTYAFSGCTSLQSVEFLNMGLGGYNGIHYNGIIYDYAFNGCIALTDLKLGTNQDGGLPYLDGPLNTIITNVFNGVTLSNVTVHVPCASEYVYNQHFATNSPRWMAQFTGGMSISSINEQIIVAISRTGSTTNITLSDGTTTTGAAISGCITFADNVTTIPANAFYGNTSITHVYGNRVGSIGDYAFFECSALGIVGFPAAISIGASAFRGSHIINPFFPKVNSIGNYAFYQCASLYSAEFPSVSSIGTYAFADCPSLLQAIIRGANLSIGAYAFAYCPSLFYADFLGVNYIAEYAFYQCVNLTTQSWNSYLDGPGGHPVASIGNYAFAECSSLEEIRCFRDAKNIGSYAFLGCTSLQNVEFLSVTSIGFAAFQGCSSLETAYFPYLTSISGQAFAYCTSLKENGQRFSRVTSIEASGFAYCSSLTEVTFRNVKTIGNTAFTIALI